MYGPVHNKTSKWAFFHGKTIAANSRTLEGQYAAGRPNSVTLGQNNDIPPFPLNFRPDQGGKSGSFPIFRSRGVYKSVRAGGRNCYETPALYITHGVTKLDA